MRPTCRGKGWRPPLIIFENKKNDLILEKSALFVCITSFLMILPNFSLGDIKTFCP